MSDLDRVRWHCRRGLLELDLVLDAFAREHLSSMSGAELEELHRLLDAADNDLWDWISGRAEPADRTLSGLVARLRAVRCRDSAP
jgi:antitoxin CptB